MNTLGFLLKIFTILGFYLLTSLDYHFKKSNPFFALVCYFFDFLFLYSLNTELVALDAPYLSLGFINGFLIIVLKVILKKSSRYYFQLMSTPDHGSQESLKSQQWLMTSLFYNVIFIPFLALLFRYYRVFSATELRYLSGVTVLVYAYLFALFLKNVYERSKSQSLSYAHRRAIPLLLLIYLIEDTLDLFCTFYPVYVIISIQVEKFLEFLEYASREASLAEVTNTLTYLTEELRGFSVGGLKNFSLSTLKKVYVHLVTFITLLVVSSLTLYLEYKMETDLVLLYLGLCFDYLGAQIFSIMN